MVPSWGQGPQVSMEVWGGSGAFGWYGWGLLWVHLSSQEVYGGEGSFL